jgi:HEAT repeat protein
MNRLVRLSLLVGLALAAWAGPPLRAPIRAEAPDSRAPAYKGKSLEAWIAALQDRDPAVRTEVATALRAYGPEAPEVVPALIGSLRDKEVRSISADALLAWGRPVVPELVKALKGKDTVIRAEVAGLLGDLQPPESEQKPVLREALKAEAVPALREALKDEDPGVRLEAACALWRITGQDEEGVWSAVVKAVASRDAAVRDKVSNRREALPDPPASAITELMKLLKGPEAGVREAALLALRGADGEDVEPAVRAAARDADGRVRAAAALVLSSFPESPQAVEALLQALKDEDLNVRQQAVSSLPSTQAVPEKKVAALTAALDDRFLRADVFNALAQIGAGAVPVLRKAVGHKDAQVRREAAAVLGTLTGVGVRDAGATEDLARLLQDDNAEVRAEAAHTLNEIGPAARGALKPLVQGLRDKNPAVRLEIVRALGGIGPDAGRAAGELRAMFKEGDVALRVEVLRALGKIGPGAAVALPEALAALQDEELAGEAASALSQLGKAAVPGLLPLLRDKKDLQEQIVSILGRLGPDAGDAVPTLVDLLKEAQGSLRLALIVALGDIGPAAKSAVPLLLPLLADKDEETRAKAALSLGRIAAEPGQVIPVLLRTLKEDKADAVRSGAALALGAFGQEAAAAVPALVPLLREPAVRQDVATALGWIGTPPDQVLPALREALKDKDPSLRATVLRALSSLGARARDVVPDLLPLLRDPDKQVHQEAEEALWRIDPQAAFRAGLRRPLAPSAPSPPPEK